MERHEQFWATTDPVDGTRWRIDVGFTDSSWTCVWGRGCVGIGDEPAPERGEGCCSVGAQLLDESEAGRIGTLGATLDPARFQYAATAADGGIYADGERRATRVVDGACIFLNRPGFDGGEGCALHLAAVDDGDSPIDWKPAVCWQLPMKVEVGDDGVRTLRRWRRDDWGPGGATMAWCCTERPDDARLPDAYIGDRPVAEALAAELSGLVGPDVAAALRARAETRTRMRTQPAPPTQQHRGATDDAQASSSAANQSTQ
ncbi:MAG: hypothetical protein AAF962_10495 [Actinomycetota bacterium]